MPNPKSTTVTVRIDKRTAIGCALLLKDQGIDPSMQPMSSTVRQALEGLIEWLIEKEALEIPPDMDIETTFVEIFKTPEPDIAAGLDEPDFEALSDALKRQAREPIETEGISKSTEPIETEDIPQIDVKALSRTPISELVERAPKDIILSQCETFTPAKVLAVEIAYTQLDPTYWGSETAIATINNLLPLCEESCGKENS